MSLLLLSLVSLAGLVAGDTPANCSYQDVEGSWIFYESERSGPSSIDCGAVDAVHKVRMILKYPDTAVDEFGNIGRWTMVYNQVRDYSSHCGIILICHAGKGFEVTVAGRTYFAFSDFSQDGKKVVSYCDRTKAERGWSHDITVRNWACFYGKIRSKFPWSRGLCLCQARKRRSVCPSITSSA